MKSRKQKFYLYEENYGDIPDDYTERLNYLYDKYNLSQSKMENILYLRNKIINSIRYTNIKIVLNEEPEGSPRPRARLVNRFNASNLAMGGGSFIKIYSITGKEDKMFMHRLMETGELQSLDRLLHTPCNVEYVSYHKTPSNFNITQTFLAEIGLQRPINKPDWDNIGKKYSDMMTGNIWIDDTLVIDGTVRKFYSIKPRIEINLSYTNILYNRYQYNGIIKSMEKLGIPTNDILYFE